MRETRIDTVRRILEDYYTPERVDVTQQGGIYQAIIWFPFVTVTNEFNQSADIKDLFVRFKVRQDGSLISTFEMGRTTFTKAQVLSNYIHSHCSGLIVPGNDQFFSCCLGSGPLVSTCASLNSSFSESMWMLFCGELDLYTKTESEEGVPYRHLNQIGTGSSVLVDHLQFYPYTLYNLPRKRFFREIVTHVVQNANLPFTFNDGMYRYALPDIDMILEFNKYILRAYNNMTNRDSNIYLYEGCILSNGKIYRSNMNRNVDVSAFAGSYITFKGERKFVTIDVPAEEELVTFTVAEPSFINAVASYILGLVNTKFALNG